MSRMHWAAGAAAALLATGCTAAPSAAITSQPADRTAAALAAIATAEADYSGRVIELEWENRYWEAEVLVGIMLHSIELSPDGATIQRRDDKPDELSAAKTAIYAESSITAKQALEKALTTEPGLLVEVELDEDYHRWLVEVRSGTGLENLQIDSRTGEVIA